MSFPTIAAEHRTGTGPDGAALELWVDPLALEALEAAREAGGTPADFGALPSLDELPLRVVGIEVRLEQLEARLARRNGGA